MLRQIVKLFIMKKNDDLSTDPIEIRQTIPYGTTGPDRVCCGTCIYWLIGRCRRRAPVPAVVSFSAADTHGQWPKTDRLDLCGEWAQTWVIESGEK